MIVVVDAVGQASWVVMDLKVNGSNEVAGKFEFNVLRRYEMAVCYGKLMKNLK